MLSKEPCVTMDRTNKRTKVLKLDQPAKMKGRKEKRIMKRNENLHYDLETLTRAASPTSRSRVTITVDPDPDMRT